MTLSLVSIDETEATNKSDVVLRLFSHSQKQNSTASREPADDCADIALKCEVLGCPDVLQVNQAVINKTRMISVECDDAS